MREWLKLMVAEVERKRDEERQHAQEAADSDEKDEASESVESQRDAGSPK